MIKVIYTLNIIVLVIGTAFFFLMLYAGIISLFEKELKAAKKAFGLAILIPLPFFLTGLIDFSFQSHVSWILIVLTIGILVLLFFPARGKYIIENDTPQNRIDERDIMFSRNLLETGTKRYENYYKRHPDYKKSDDTFRSLPGLLSSQSKNYHPFSFASAEANFKTVEFLKQAVSGTIAQKQLDPDPGEISNYIKHWALQIGAHSVGITGLKDYHLYSHHGRGENYGKTIEKKHKYAISFTVEMVKFMVGCAPEGPAIMESAQQYLASGTIAVQVAEFIRKMGYPARAHIDGNYHVVCPLVARDAGLGEIGRMGLLMTPDLGPRIRISVVTTDLPLITNKRKPDPAIIDFCTHCKKCADVCPTKAIPFFNKKEINKVKRWQINSEACFTYWCLSGTDCGSCISVCPFSHPDKLLHNFIRFGIRNSVIFRKLAVRLDDFFYGKKPDPLDFPDWMKVRT